MYLIVAGQSGVTVYDKVVDSRIDHHAWRNIETEITIYVEGVGLIAIKPELPWRQAFHGIPIHVRGGNALMFVFMIELVAGPKNLI